MIRLLESVWYRRREPLASKLLLSPLWLVSVPFGVAARARVRRLTQPGRARRVPARVISVGNLTVGGAGKTPVVVHLARRLLAAGERPIVLSRGYGRGGGDGRVVVSDGAVRVQDPELAGDEPLLIARACPGVPVVVGLDRAALASWSVEEFGATTVILDDGFQHLRLARDLDLVVIDASNPYGNGHLLPRGPLRESRAALRRAGLVWLSKVDQAPPEQVERLAEEARTATGRAPVRAAYRLVDVTRLDGGSEGPEALRDRRVLLLAGIARPDSFRRTLRSAGATIVGEEIYPDHHGFTPHELQRAVEAARRRGAEAIALTEKDAVRLPAGAEGPFRVVRIDVEILEGSASLDAALAAATPSAAAASAAATSAAATSAIATSAAATSAAAASAAATSAAATSADMPLSAAPSNAKSSTAAAAAPPSVPSAAPTSADKASGR